MTTLNVVQATALIISLVFIGYQTWLTRHALQEQKNQLKVQSYLQIWNLHISTAHLPIIESDDAVATALNSMSPYASLPIDEARAHHFADAVLDVYECISLLSLLKILDEEVAREWRDSVPYEFQNPLFREHWRNFHARAAFRARLFGNSRGVYHAEFARYVNECLEVYDKASQAE